MPAALALLAIAGCGGGSDPPPAGRADGPIRVGLLSCAAGAGAGDAVRSFRVCPRGDIVEAARELVEGYRVDIVVSFARGDGLALALYAETQADKTFLDRASTGQEATLGVQSPNFFRFSPDAAQRVAGLGTYAYRDLGWRTARAQGGLAAAGFAAEFCRLGGRIVNSGGDGAFVRGRVGEVTAAPATPPGDDTFGAMVRALAEVGWDLSSGHAQFRAALARQARFDENRQVIVDVVLRRSGRPFRRIGNVDQSLGGAFTPNEPAGAPAC